MKVGNPKNDSKVENSKDKGGNRGRSSTQTKTKKQSGKSSTTTVKGDHISGCVIQLLVGDEVKRSFATKSTWSKLAAKNPLPEEEILKFR